MADREPGGRLTRVPPRPRAQHSLRVIAEVMAGQTGLPILADTRALSRFARDLREASPEAWRACRLVLRAAAEPVAADARGRASFSTRIPGSRFGPGPAT